MGRITKEILLVVLIVILVFTLSSCISGPVQSREIYSGTKGLVAEFSSAVPDEVYENSSFPLAIKIVNDGTYTITKENPAIISVITDKLYFSIEDEDKGYNKKLYLEGRSELFPNGEILMPELPYMESKALYGAIQNPKSDIYFSMCYPYETTFSDNMCMDFDVHGMDQREKVCKSEELKFMGGQGAPIAITKITPIMKVYNNAKLKPKFMIEIQNKGKGLPWYSENNKCSDAEFDKEEWNKVKISGTLSSLNLVCNPEIVRLIDNKGLFTCEVDGTFPIGTNYLSSINFKLEYNYIESISKTIDIVRTNDADFYATSDPCKDKLDGESCSIIDKKVCYKQECVDKCIYCAETYPSSSNKVDCGNVKKGFSCSCSETDLTKISATNYQKNMCEHKICCLKMSDLDIGIAKKDNSGNYESPKKIDTESLEVEKDYTYAFSIMLDTPSDYYCTIELYDKSYRGVIKGKAGNCDEIIQIKDVNPDNFNINEPYIVLAKVYANSTKAGTPLNMKSKFITFTDTGVEEEQFL